MPGYIFLEARTYQRKWDQFLIQRSLARITNHCQKSRLSVWSEEESRPVFMSLLWLYIKSKAKFYTKNR